MSTSPWVKFYASDWIGGTSGLTAAERGVYITIVALIYENDGPVKIDDARLARQCGITKASFRKVLSALLSERKLIETKDGLINERCEKELSERANRAQKATIAASQKWNAQRQKSVENQRPNSANASAKQCLDDAYTRSQKPEPDIDTGSVPNGTGENADFHKRALFGNGVKYLTAHGRRESEARAIIGRWLKDNSKEAVFNAFAASKEAGAVEPVAYIGRILKGRENERFDAWGIPDLSRDTGNGRNTERDDSWDAPVYLPAMQSSAEADEQANQVPVCDDEYEWRGLDVPSLRVVGGREQ